MALLLLYLATGIATAIPVVWALGWAVWGAGTSLTEYISLFGSLILVVSAFVNLSNRRAAARLALVGVSAIWSLYLPGIVGVVRIRLTDQELGLSVLLWKPAVASLVIHDVQQIPNFPDMTLSPVEIQQIKSTGITGEVSTHTANNRYGTGKKSHVILIMQKPVAKPVELKEPDAASVIYVQYAGGWKMFPANARTLERKIRLQPDAQDPNQSLLGVELATGASQGFGILWPRASSGNSEE
ncbi:MAG TPA: hypothetical protein VNH83_06555 [Bryobacteraceae bacterium]|jgi:hypothetical protein|nr:hypothetical protein [Bryobacteraceae bacterium]